MKPSSRSLLSLYLMGGFGHIKPAQALVEQFHKLGIHGVSYDPFSPDGSPTKETANLYNFITTSPFLSPFWNLISRHDLLPAAIFEPGHALEILANLKVIQRLKRLGLDRHLIITATHWTPALLAAHAFPHTPIFLYVTDIHPHGLWKTTPKNIHYLVPMEETKIDILRYGMDSDRVTICSFPIHNEILTNNQARHLRRLNTLRRKRPEKIDVLIISGGAGTGRQQMRHLIDKFSHPAKTNQVKVTFLVSTPQLEVDLISYCAKIKTHKAEIFVDRYTPHSLYPALTHAEILITKAGGDITFEALAEGLPIYCLKDVGDHERLNRQYLELIGAARPLFLSQQPWQQIESDILSEEILLMTQASHRHGAFHRRSTTPKVILNFLKH